MLVGLVPVKFRMNLTQICFWLASNDLALVLDFLKKIILILSNMLSLLKCTSFDLVQLTWWTNQQRPQTKVAQSYNYTVYIMYTLQHATLLLQKSCPSVVDI